jgi:NAD(P)-dependent dehydrogenase (short-subunit alcohol dehydrogenase family)
MVTIDLSGKTALVTGGGRGLGREISLLLAEAGANVAVNYVRHPNTAAETAEEARRAGVDAVAVQGDVSHHGDVERVLSEVEERFGGVHVLVSNAATGVLRGLPELDRRGVLRTFEICAWPLLDVSRRLFPGFAKARFGRIVAISSPGSRRVAPGYAAMGMAKAALEALTRYLAEHAGRELENVTANAVVPSGFHGGEVERLPFEPLARHMLEEEPRTPGGRAPTMREVAGVVLFLASDLSAAVNGQTLAVDRGWSIR